ncbi:MAG: cupin domain-containing protein [Bauldia sp.]
MLSETLQSGLERYRIGAKVKALRTAKELGLVQLGEHTGLSPAMLSKIERGQLFPTLPTLLRIAMVFGVGLDHFFLEEERSLLAVIRKGERIRLPDQPGDAAPAYVFESLDFPVTDRKMDAYLAEFPAGAKASQPHRHQGAEFIYTLSGRLALAIDGRETVLEAGDTAYFDPDRPHSYRSAGNAACAALVVVAA